MKARNAVAWVRSLPRRGRNPFAVATLELALLFIALLPAGCSHESAATKPDTTPPPAVADLRAAEAGRTTIALVWTAAGDGGTDDGAAVYDLRYASFPIADSTWVSATQVDGEPTPRRAGETETFTLGGLTPGRTWYFALKAADRVPNWSALSNVGSFATLPPDTIRPAAIRDARIIATGEDTVTLTWTSVGDDSLTGRAAGVAFLSSRSPIDDATWSGPGFRGFLDSTSPGTSDTLEFRGLASSTTYYFSLRTVDAAGNRSGLSNPVSGATASAIPPATVTDLTLLATTEHTLTVGWTAVGDDGMTAGAPVSYEIRVSTSPIDESNWDAYVGRGEVSGGSPGTPLTSVVTTDGGDSTYYVALKAEDDVGAWSGLSNVISGRAEDTIPPPGIEDLRVALPGSPTDPELLWTAVGDDGTSERLSGYDIRYSSEPITEANWGRASRVPLSNAPLYPGATEACYVTDLEIGRYYFAMKGKDEAGNWSVLSNVALGIVPFRLEAEGYSGSSDRSGGAIARVGCDEASGSNAVDGVDGGGDWIQIPFELLQRACFTDSLRSAGALGLRRTFAIDYYTQVRGDAGTLLMSDTVTTIPGIGIGCSGTHFDFRGSSRIICLDPGSYLARIRRIGGARDATRIDCLDLRETAD